MNILYTCDNNYIWIMGISVISLFENNRHINTLTVYLLGQNVSDENKSELNAIAQLYDRKIIFIDVSELDIPFNLASGRWPLSAFIRLFSGRLLPKDINRILYLDCDTIIKGNLEPLEDIDISVKIFYGIKDCIGGIYKQNIGLNWDSVYINAGVLLINLNRLRQVNIMEIFNRYISQYHMLINYADQDILNGIFCDMIGVLPPQYNVMTIDIFHSYGEIITLRRPTNFYSEIDFLSVIDEPVIIHYTTNMRVVRPWFKNTNHPLAEEYRKYMLLSPWNDKILSDMVFNSKEAKIIGFIQWLPNILSYKILGMMHAVLKPLYIRVKATKSLLINKGKG